MIYVKFAIALIISIVLSLIGTPVLINFLQKKNGGQCIREEGPRSHLSKAGTPTMGGISMAFSILVAAIALRAISPDMIVILAGFFGFGLLGFLDDFVKIFKKRNLGLTARQKILLQIILAVLISFYLVKVSLLETYLVIPFTDKTIDLGVWYIPFIIFVIIAMVNSVNLTDGLDGLASGVTMFVALFFALASAKLGLLTPGIFSAALAGACIGFLAYNRYPASIFMGDTGSMALGGGLAVTAIVMKLELFLLIVGLIYVIEALSVILQVTYFKITKGKRLFKMSPIHHHFELSGWHESQVVTGFYIASAILCVIAYIGL